MKKNMCREYLWINSSGRKRLDCQKENIGVFAQQSEFMLTLFVVAAKFEHVHSKTNPNSKMLRSVKINNMQLKNQYHLSKFKNFQVPSSKIILYLNVLIELALSSL